MEEKYEGKRMKKHKGPPLGCVIALAAAGCLAAVYLGLCGYVSASGRVLPHVTAAGVDLGGLNAQQAAQRLDEEAAARYGGKTVTLSAGAEEVELDLDQMDVSFQNDALIQRAMQEGRGMFLLRGGSFLAHLFGAGAEVTPLTDENGAELNPLTLSDAALEPVLEQAAQAVEQPVIQHSFLLSSDTLVLQAGQPGMLVDRAALRAQLLDNLLKQDFSDLTLEPQVTQPDELDLNGVYDQIHVEPVNAALDGETYEITPSVTGVSFDVDAARSLLERTAPGESCQVPLIFTEPEITTEELEATLFHDLLGEAKTNVGGTNSRASNVGLAAGLCNERILMPGDVFSYWDAIKPCTRAQGFLPAPSYVSGNTVDSIGGGVCQVSSSIYYAALLSNLEIVERKNHTFAVGYIDDGMDATVYGGGNPDFKFKNNTPYPIKIVASLSGRALTVQIWGTKVDDTYVKMEHIRLSTTPYETVYKPDESVPVGSTRVEVTPYTGRVVEAYRCIYDGSGNLISRTFESKNYYSKRDQIILYNPADPAHNGTGEGTTPPEPTPPVETTPPEPTPPVETPPVTPTPTPEPTATPAPDFSFPPTPTPEVPAEPTPTLDPVGPGTSEEEP